MYEIHGVSPENYVPTAERYNDFFSPEERKTMSEGLIRATAPGRIRSEIEVAINLPNGERRLISNPGYGDLEIRMTDRSAWWASRKTSPGRWRPRNCSSAPRKQPNRPQKAKSEFLASSEPRDSHADERRARLH